MSQRPRSTACYHILEDESGDFTPEEKQRAEWLKVWQLTEHATDQDRDAVTAVGRRLVEIDLREVARHRERCQRVVADARDETSPGRTPRPSAAGPLGREDHGARA